MDIEKRLINHYKRWNIDFSEEEEFEKFKNRLLSILQSLIGSFLIKNVVIDKRFSEIIEFHKAQKPYIRKSTTYREEILQDGLMMGLLEPIHGLKKNTKIITTEKGFGDTNVYKEIVNCKSTQEIATNLQFLFWAMEDNYNETKNLLPELVKEIRKISSLTPSVSFQLYQKVKQVIIYPYGDPFLDEGIINYVLSGLEEYPDIAKHFENALQIYQRGEESQYRNLLDNLRFSLEQLLKKILGNEKSFENQSKTLKEWIKNKGLHSQIANLYNHLVFNIYSEYMNDAVKHNEKYSLDEIEFMIYLTGNFMRLLIQLSKKE
jgi:hypothetical protein